MQTWKNENTAQNFLTCKGVQVACHKCKVTCRALTNLWLDDAEQQLCDRALNFVTRMMDMPSAGNGFELAVEC
eukprot:2243220-Amphidinium_carterae.1